MIKIIFILLLALSLSLPVNIHARSDPYEGCDFDKYVVSEDKLRNDPVFMVFLEKYPESVFYNIVSESFPAWYDASFSYPDDGLRSATAILTSTTRDCMEWQVYTLNLPSGTHNFYLDAAFPYGPPGEGVILSSMDEIVYAVSILLGVDAKPPEDKMENASMEEKMEHQIRLKMDSISRLPENNANSFDYWCLSDRLTKIVESRMINSDKKMDDEKLEKFGAALYEMYYTDDVFVDPKERSLIDLDYGVGQGTIDFLIDAEKPIKMSKAQELLNLYSFITISRMPPPYEDLTITCKDTLKEILDVNTVTPINKPNHKSFMNLRGDVVSIHASSIIPLYERGYLILRLS